MKTKIMIIIPLKMATQTKFRYMSETFTQLKMGPTLKAEKRLECRYFVFVITNIANWATDGGVSLHKQEKGCGAITGWNWQHAMPNSYPGVSFNLPLFILKVPDF
jgi:hypothetical protein